MPIPNAIVRTLDLPHPQEKVWSALSTVDGLTSWFGNAARGEVAPGRDLMMTWDGHDGEMPLEIKVVDPMSLFAFCWAVSGAPDDDPRRTYVEFALAPSGSGTRLTVTESGFAQLPDEWLENTYRGNIEGWQAELGDLVAHLDAG